MNLLRIFYQCEAKAQDTCLTHLAKRMGHFASYFSYAIYHPSINSQRNFSKATGVPMRDLISVEQGDRKPIDKLLNDELQKVNTRQQYKEYLRLVGFAYGGLKHLILKYTHGKTYYMPIVPNLYNSVQTRSHLIKDTKAISKLTGCSLKPLLKKVNEIAPELAYLSAADRKNAIAYFRTYREYYYPKSHCRMSIQLLLKASNYSAHMRIKHIASTLHVSKRNLERVLNGDTRLVPNLRAKALKQIKNIQTLRHYLRILIAVYPSIKHRADNVNQYNKIMNALSRPTHFTKSKSVWIGIAKTIGKWTNQPMDNVIKKIKSMDICKYSIHISSRNSNRLRHYMRTVCLVQKYLHKPIPKECNEIYSAFNHSINNQHLNGISHRYRIPLGNIWALIHGKIWPQRQLLDRIVNNITGIRSLRLYLKALPTMYKALPLTIKHHDDLLTVRNVLYHSHLSQDRIIRAVKLMSRVYNQPVSRIKQVLTRIQAYRIGVNDVVTDT